jgi:hypothetical protein
MPAQESVIYPESVTELPLSSLRSRSFLPSHLDTRLLIPSLDVRWNSSGWSRSMTNLWKTFKNLPRGLRASFAALNSLILRGKLVAKNWIRRRNSKPSSNNSGRAIDAAMHGSGFSSAFGRRPPQVNIFSGSESRTRKQQTAVSTQSNGLCHFRQRRKCICRP